MYTGTRGFIKRRSASGLTLVELMIALPLILIIGGIVVVMLYNYVNLYLANNDMVVASQRADVALRLMQTPILHAGLGTNTVTSDDYRKSWNRDNNSTNIASAINVPFPAKWEDAVWIRSTDSQGWGTELGVVYAMPSGMKIDEETSVKDSTRTGFVIDLQEDPPAISFPTEAPTERNMHAWVATPGTDTSTPMLVAAYNPGERKLTVDVPGQLPNGGRELPLPLFQDIYLMKAAWFRVVEVGGSYELRMTDLSNQIGVPVDSDYLIHVEKIRAVRFRLSEDRKFMEVRVLAMGDTYGAKHAQALSSELKERWGDELDEATDAGYYFEEFSMKWRVRNIGQES